jgi:opacity protein-like surface antigen
MKKAGVVILGFLLLVVSGAPVSAAGPYVGGQLGAVFLSDMDIDQSGFTFDTSFDTGFGGSLAGGYAFDPFRVEGEVFYKTNDFEEASFGGVTLPADGDMSALGLMVNVYVDFKNRSRFTPFLGVGAGFAQVSVNDLVIDGLPIADDDDTVLAYQGIAGVGFSITPAFTVDLAYKYTATEDPSFTDLGGDSFEAEYASHNVMVGVRYNF